MKPTFWNVGPELERRYVSGPAASLTMRRPVRRSSGPLTTVLSWYPS